MADSANSRYLLVEFQDENGNVMYGHTDARVVWLPDGSSVAEFLLQRATDDDIDKALIE